MVNERYEYYEKWENLLQKQIEYDKKIDELLEHNEHLEQMLRNQLEKHDRLLNDFNDALELWKIDIEESENRKRTIDELNLKIHHLQKKPITIDLTNESDQLSFDLNESSSEEEILEIDLNGPSSEEYKF